MIATPIDHPSMRWTMSASAKRLTPEMRTVAIAEGDGVERVRRLVEAKPQVLRDGAHLRAVVERHHHQPEEDHRRDGADPVVMDRRHAVLRAVGCLAEDLQRSEVGGDEGHAGDPRRQPAARQEEVDVGLDRQAGDDADAQDDQEVDREDRVVESARM
jgi:hypothetical protein